MTNPTTNQSNSSLSYKYNPATSQWQLQNSQNSNPLIHSPDSLAEEGAAHAIGTMGDVLDAIAPEGSLRGLVVKGMITVAGVAFDYARNLKK